MGYNSDGRDSIKNILGLTSQYLVPRYQRRYIWDEKRWLDLFDDIKFIYQMRESGQKCNHFLSTFIFEKASTTNNGVDNYNIIDGQQRISTIMVIIAAICRMFNELEDQIDFNLYTQYLIANGSSGLFVKIDNDNTDLLVQIISNCTNYKTDKADLYPVNIRRFNKYDKEQKNIVKCYIYFYEHIKELLNWNSIDDNENKRLKLKNYISVVLEMQAISIIAEDEQSGYDVFEILNARGTPLAGHELLKNYIFKYYQPIAQVDNAKNLWLQMERDINIKNDIYIAYFIDHYITHKYSKASKSNSILRIIKNANERNDTKKILEDIVLKSKYYKWFIDPKSFLDNTLLENKCATEEIYSVLMYFSLKNQIQFRPLFLSIFSKIEETKERLLDAGIDEEQIKSNKEFKEIVNAAKNVMLYLLKYSLAYFGVLKEQPKTIEDKIHELAQKIERNEYTFDEVYKKFVVKANNELFGVKFADLGYSNKNKLYERKKTSVDIRQLMRMYELYLQGTDELTIDNMTIEHITNDDELDPNVVKFGNLIPLAEELQKEIGVETDYQNKYKIYKKSAFKTVQELCNQFNNWDNSSITKRTNYLADVFYYKILADVFKL